jgi:transcriptional regulator with AAA-type ATPase domain/tetratricopeptide (TPR) repeat protein
VTDVLADLLGGSPAFEEVKARARRMLSGASAGARLPLVLIQGETGSGKGLLASVLHKASPRAAGPFISVNCGAVPETLGEAEFFGVARGAHSEARQAKVGFFQAADGGTLFLDEVGLLSEGHQRRLLKVLEDRTVVPVGSTRPVPINVWVISATNADLTAQVRAGTFRRDLYERLAVMPFALPPLRDRRADIPLLADRLLARACEDYKLPPKTFDADAKQRLFDYGWPGNVRELSNVIERAVLCVEGPVVPASRLEIAPPDLPAVEPAAPAAPPRGDRRQRRQRIEAALTRMDGNISRAAAELKVSRKTLRAWMKEEHLYPYTGAVEPAELEPGRGALPAEAPGLWPAVPAGGLPAAMGGRIHWQRQWVTLLRVRAVPRDGDTPGDVTGALEVAADKVQAFGGHVVELHRAGLDAAFGLDPIDDAPQRAAFAALAIQRACASSAGHVAVAVGLHAETCVVGRIGSSPQIDQDAKQAASAVLAELVAAASGGVLASDALFPFLRRRLAFDEPIAIAGGKAYPILGRASQAFGGEISTFVGRRSEMALLDDRWALAAQGLGQIVGIVGDPGVGKSRLVWEFLHSDVKRAGLTLATASVSLGRPTPYLAIIELLRAYFGVEAGEPEALVRERVTERLRALDESLLTARPAFLSLLDVPAGDPAWDALPPSRRRQRTLEAMKRLMLRESARQPLLLVLEDAHWADSETRALLDDVVDSLPVARVLMLVTYRPEYQHAWGDRTFYTQLRVDPLRGESVARFLRELIGADESLDALRGRLVEWTDGNPFFLEETVRTLAESRVLQGERGAYAVNQPIAAIAVPDTVQEVLAGRMARLGAVPHGVLQSASVVGRRVPHHVVAAVSGLSTEVLGETLKTLQVREFLSESGHGDDREYTFRHALTQEVAYASLPDEQRRGLHAAILESLERVYAEDRIADLAHHAFEGQRWERAVGYLRRAGERAFARSANREAATCFENALAALARLPETRPRQELGIDLRFDLRNALNPLGPAHRTLVHLREAESLAEKIGDERRLGRAVSFSANCLVLMAEYSEAIAVGRRASSLAGSLADFPLQVASGMYLGRAYVGLGQYRRAAEVLGEVAGSLTGERMRDYLGLPVLPAVFARSHLVLALSELGEFAEAEAQTRRAIELAEESRNPDTLLWAHGSAGMVDLVRGRLEPAIRALEHALELCRAADLPIYIPLVGSPLGLAYALTGRADEGLAIAEQAVQQTQARQQVALQSWTLLRLAEVQHLAGRPAAAETATRVLELFREHAERGGEAYARRLLGECAAAAGDAPAAELLLEEAALLARELEMRPLGARSDLELARLLIATGREDAGRLLLAEVRSAVDGLGMAHWSRAAAELADGGR